MTKVKEMYISCQYSLPLICRTKMRRFLFFILQILIFLYFISCDLPENKTESKDNISLGYAIGFKAYECGNYPNYPLFIADGSAKPAQRDIQACSLTIIQQKCPFTHYPYYCLKIFKNFEFDIEIKNPLKGSTN